MSEVIYAKIRPLKNALIFNLILLINLLYKNSLKMYGNSQVIYGLTKIEKFNN